ncbi:PQQ-binding-like beta-propeller repeat protein [Streptomyces monticola]|uniref:PQQ-binding-like beta-propeller repeat protein n=1 Tax=Streptomyces monticola TaxID=2666263 RepID=A0ABW2JI53_9ACTN
MAQDAQGTGAGHGEAGGAEELPEIPGYRLDGLLGAGGMGHVYLGTSPSGRQVAVKVIRSHLAQQADFRGRFRREVTAARQVSGAFTAPVLDADPDADPPWMATLYVPGTPLDARIKEGPAFTDEELYRLALGLAEALRDIHRAGIVHRDLKPGNVLLADDGPRVIDFGIVRAADADMLTHTGIAVGTPPFMSPEQIRAQKDVGPPSDIFSLGSVMTYAASGHVPFDATDVYAVAYQLVHESPDLDGVPDWLLPVVERCLAKDQSERPDADGLLRLLQDIWAGHAGQPVVTSDSPGTMLLRAPSVPSVPAAPSVTAAPASAVPPAPPAGDAGSAPTPPPRGRWRRVLAVAAAVAAVAGLTGGLLYGLRGDGDPDPKKPDAQGEGSSPGRNGGRPPQQPPGSADYLGTQSGSAAFTFTYRDRPERRPDGWRQWQYTLQNSDCAYAQAARALLCVGDETVLIDAATGEQRWKTGKASSYGQNTPVVARGTAVVNIGEAMVGLRLKDGKEVWRYKTPVLTQRLITDGTNVYAADHSGLVHAVDVATGEKRWTRTARTSPDGGTGHVPALRALDGKVYVFTGTDTDSIGENLATVIDAGSGRRTAEFELGADCTIGTQALMKEDGAAFLYCGAEAGPEGSGGLLRQKLAKGAKALLTPVDAAIGGGQVGAPELAVAPGRVLLVADGELVAVDPVARRELWRKPVPGKGVADAPPVWAGDRIYVATTSAAAAYDAKTGKQVWQHSIPELPDGSEAPVGLDTEPMVAGGVLFAPSTKAGWVSLDTYAK